MPETLPDAASASERARHAALLSYDVLDTPPESAFDRITSLAAHIFGAPIALVSLVDEHRQWFKSACGVAVKETAREIAFCDHAIRGTSVMVVEDAARDPRFAANPLVTGEPHIRFYAGAPLLAPSGFALGTLCVIDRVPRRFEPHDQAILAELAAQVVHELEMRAALGRNYATVAEGRRTQAALQRANSQLEAVLDATGTALVMTDSERRIMSWNWAAQQIFQYANSEAIGQPVDMLLAAWSNKADNWQIAHWMSASSLASATITLARIGKRKDGSEFPIELTISRAQPGDNGAATFSVIIRDVSDREKTWAELQRSRAHLADAQRIANLGSWEWNLSTGKWALSEQMYRLSGLPFGAVPSLETMVATVHPDDRAFVRAALERDAAGEESAGGRARRVMPDGTIRYLRTRGQAVRDQTGRITHVVGISLDVTEHVKREGEQHQREVGERQREKLRSLGELAGGIAHEINNLLHPIISLSETVRARCAPIAGTETDEDLATVIESAHQARDIVRKILMFARRETSALTPIALAEEIRRTASFVRSLLPPAVVLREDPTTVTGMATINSVEMTQVLTNLAINAGHAMHGRGTITLSLAAATLSGDEAAALKLAPGPYFKLAVADTGCGMDEATRQRVFDPFFTTKPVGEGSGLGLSVVHGIVRGWNGAIAVESEIGRGSVFTIYIPETTPREPATP